MLWAIDAVSRVRARFPYDSWKIRIREDKRRISPSGVSLRYIEQARTSAKVVIGGDAGDMHPRAERCLIRSSRRLMLVSGTTVASGASKRTTFCGFGGMSLSLREKLDASPDGARTSMASALLMGYFMSILLSGSAWEVRQAATSSPVRLVLGITVECRTAGCTVFFRTIGTPYSERGGSVLS